MTQSLGGSYDPFGVHLQDPYALYAETRRSEPVFFSEKINAWVVTRWEDVHQILRSTEAFSSANSIRPLVEVSPKAFAVLAQGYPQRPVSITTDGEDHKRRRAPLARSFGQEAVAAHEGFILARATELVGAFAGVEHGRVELRAALTDRLPLDVLVRLFALDPSDRQLVTDASVGLVRLFAAPKTEDEQVELARTVLGAQQLAGRYVRERIAELGEDIISRLVRAHVPDAVASENQDPIPLTVDQEADIVAEVVENWLAGHVTTQGILANGVRALLDQRDQWELLTRRPELIGNAVEEILRYDSSVPGLLRVATQPVTVAGKSFPPGSEFALMFGAANRDPQVINDPDRLDITRATPKHVTFGHGVHFCAGAPVARKQLTVVLETLTRRLPGLRLAAGYEPVFEPMFNLRVPRTLEVAW